MKTLNSQISNLQLEELSKNELSQITGGSWLGEVAGFVGFVAGTVVHAVIDATLLVTGNYGDHVSSPENWTVRD